MAFRKESTFCEITYLKVSKISELDLEIKKKIVQKSTMMAARKPFNFKLSDFH